MSALFSAATVTLCATTPIVAPFISPIPASAIPIHIVALATALTISAALLRRFAPAKRRAVRASAILFVVLVFAMALGQGFALLHWYEYASRTLWAAALIETFLVINLVTICFFDLVLKVVHLEPASIVSDMLIGCAYFVALIHEMHVAGVNLSGIVTTGAVVSGVLGLSLAPTLGNILGGVALQLDHSISEGDWLQLDANTQGRVKAIRWRHTVVETRNWDTIIVPNATLLSSNIMILGKRTDQPSQRRYWIYFNVDFRYEPSEVITAVNAALDSCAIPRVAAEPKAHCICFDFARDGRDSVGYYAVRYWLMDLAVDDPTNSAVRERIYAGLKRANIPLAVPASTVFLSNDNADHRAAKARREHERRVELLGKLEMFTEFTPDEREALAARLIYAAFARNEVITHQGREAHWLYILARGEADVQYEDADGATRRVGTLRAPDFFGEMGVMTGQPRSATVTAKTACDCYRLDKEAFQKILHERRELALLVSDVLVARRQGLRHAQEGLSAEQHQKSLLDAREKLLGQIQSFFGLN